MKKLFHIYFFIVLFLFLNSARKSFAPFMEIFFPHDKLLHGQFPQHTPLFSTTPPPNQENPSENVSTLPNNHYYNCKHITLL